MIYGNVYKDYINISAQDIRALSEYCQSMALDRDDDYFDNVQFDPVVEECFLALEAVGINKGEVEKQSRQAARKANDIIKKEGITETSKHKIRDAIESAISGVAHIIDKNAIINELEKKKDQIKKFTLKKLVQAAVLTEFAAVTNGIVFAVCSAIFTPPIAQGLLGIIAAPIIEESAKAIAIKLGIAAEFAFVFNAFEFGQYVLKAWAVTKGAKVFSKFLGDALGIDPSIDYNITKFVGMRLAVVAMHCTTIITQFVTSNKEWQDKFFKAKGKKPEEVTEEDRKQLAFIGRILGFIIHASWNTWASFSRNSFIDEINTKTGEVTHVKNDNLADQFKARGNKIFNF